MKNPAPIIKIKTLFRIFSLFICLLFVTSTSAHPGSGIVVDKDGNVYFTDTGQGVWKIDPKGTLTSLPSSRFHWMAIDEAGKFAGAQGSFGNWFERVTGQNNVPAIVTCSDFPITINKNGDLFYADTRPGSPRIMRRTAAGKESVLASGELLGNISGITAAPDGSLYVSNASLINVNTIRKITMDGKVSVIASGFAGKAIPNPPPETMATYCRGLAVDPSGNVYVAATGTRSVLKITPAGKVSTFLESTAPWSPTGVTIFRGEVYVLEYSDAPPSKTEERKAWIPRVRKIGVDGKVTILATISR